MVCQQQACCYVNSVPARREKILKEKEAELNMIQYLTGLSALAVSSGNKTMGDWHLREIKETDMRETEDEYGLNYFKELYLDGVFLHNIYVANHYRALADLFREYINTPLLRLLKGSVEDYLDGDAAGLLDYLRELDIKTEESKKICIHEFGLQAVKKWL